jgi:hypothetical protein
VRRSLELQTRHRACNAMAEVGDNRLSAVHEMGNEMLMSSTMGRLSSVLKLTKAQVRNSNFCRAGFAHTITPEVPQALHHSPLALHEASGRLVAYIALSVGSWRNIMTSYYVVGQQWRVSRESVRSRDRWCSHILKRPGPVPAMNPWMKGSEC